MYMVPLLVSKWYRVRVVDIENRVIDSAGSGCGTGAGAIGSFCESRTREAPRRRQRPLPLRDDLYHERLVGADLGTAEETWLLTVADRSAEWYQAVTGVSWTPAGRAFYLGRLTAICRHWSDPTGHGLHRGWHFSDTSTDPAPWTCQREREECWSALDPRPVCRRQAQSVTRLVLGTATCPGHFDLLRHGIGSDTHAVPARVVQAWATAVYLCDPVAARTVTNARYLQVRRAAARHHSAQADEALWDLQRRPVREYLLSA